MAKRQKRKKGLKIGLSGYFKKIKENDYVAVIREPSHQPSFPKRIQGKTGIVEGERGKSKIVKLMDGKKEKRFIIEPIHLKKIKIIKKSNE